MILTEISNPLEMSVVFERLGFQQIIAAICGNCLRGRRLLSLPTSPPAFSPEDLILISVEFNSDIKSDIPYHMTYFYCDRCCLNVCANCHSSHASTHAQNLSRFTTVPWSGKSKDISRNGNCSECAQEVKCRVECTICLRSICVGCFKVLNLSQRWLEHHRQDLSSRDHKEYRRVTTPHFSIKSINTISSERCQCLSGSEVWEHCQRCQKGIDFLCV